MTEAEINLIPLADLPARYGISRSVIYDRLGALNVESIRSGKKAFIPAQYLKLLDELDEHLKGGGLTSEFINKNSGTHTATNTRQLVGEKPTSLIEDQAAILTLMKALVDQLL